MAPNGCCHVEIIPQNFEKVAVDILYQKTVLDNLFELSLLFFTETFIYS